MEPMQPMSRRIVGPVIATMNLTPETSDKIIFWMITAIAGSSLRIFSAREANTPLAVQSRPPSP